MAMQDLDLVDVYTVKNPAIGEIICNALEAEGIPCRLDNESQAGLTGIFDIQVLVRAADADRARELIEAHVPDEMDDIETGPDADDTDE
jgi:hypothetical protein